MSNLIAGKVIAGKVMSSISSYRYASHRLSYIIGIYICIYGYLYRLYSCMFCCGIIGEQKVGR